MMYRNSLQTLLTALCISQVDICLVEFGFAQATRFIFVRAFQNQVHISINFIGFRLTFFLLIASHFFLYLQS